MMWMLSDSSRCRWVRATVAFCAGCLFIARKPTRPVAPPSSRAPIWQLHSKH